MSEVQGQRIEIVSVRPIEDPFCDMTMLVLRVWKALSAEIDLAMDSVNVAFGSKLHI